MAASSTRETDLQTAATWLDECNALFIGTGAGMGVESGLATYRGANAGVWPPLQRLGLDFSDCSNPAMFIEDPYLAWSFWKHRYECYSSAVPHEGYHILRQLANEKELGGFSFTSNVDGHWLRSGWPEDRLIECHGSVHFMQCQQLDEQCEPTIWPTNPTEIANIPINPTDDRAQEPVPRCANCSRIARPNVLMFADAWVLMDRMGAQYDNEHQWKSKVKAHPKPRVLVIEIGAGVAVPAVRSACEEFVTHVPCASLIRINPEYPEVPAALRSRSISLPMGCLDALRAIIARRAQPTTATTTTTTTQSHV